MKFEHLCANLQKYRNLSSKKSSYFNFEIKSLTFLGFNLYTILYFKPDFGISPNYSVFLESENYENHKTIIKLLFFFFFLLFCLFFINIISIDQLHINNNYNHLNLIFYSDSVSSYKIFNNCNLFFNNLLITIIQEHKLIF